MSESFYNSIYYNYYKEIFNLYYNTAPVAFDESIYYNTLADRIDIGAAAVLLYNSLDNMTLFIFIYIGNTLYP